ncbi:metal-sensing transcriptional repressor [Texcoconibacillus texcoconensis]|uniref:DNA-binding FrmR family transcriptional regulator n=1 Tax=Texcoconibacillus texcoconensis TaxID=1095777 RepID=A0A840QT06_9BACI|nr:metal-sensing transcriptional repressor [Texcoconibacillus texcoconensis]MBB5174439.1 DNA-binding FrmR family transcriptional regulator [Texcoconibacillus texcoconensis]
MDNDNLNIELTPDTSALTQRSEEEKQQLLNRLKRVEGQVRGIQRMVEDDRYCVDVLVQLSAINAALKKVGYSMLENHTRGCVASAVQEGNGDEAIEELMKVIQQFSKS